MPAYNPDLQITRPDKTGARTVHRAARGPSADPAFTGDPGDPGCNGRCVVARISRYLGGREGISHVVTGCNIHARFYSEKAAIDWCRSTFG
jgi:hypothetical protein